MRNLLNPGDYVIAEPLGIKMVLRYDERGVVDKVEVGPDYDTLKNVTKELLQSVKNCTHIPTKVGLRSGSTFVRGTLSCASLLSLDHGEVSKLWVDEYVDKFSQMPDNFAFYGTYVESNATMFNGAVSIRQWLDMSKFRTLPGQMVPAKYDYTFINRLLQSNQFDHPIKVLGAITIFRGTRTLFHTFPHMQTVVKRVNRTSDDEGNVLGAIVGTDSNISLTVPWSDIVRNNIQPNSLIIYDKSRNILHTECTDDKVREPRSTKITCNICGRTFTVPKVGPTVCSAPGCMSIHYKAACNMLRNLRLPSIDKVEYDKLVESKQILNIVDILDIYPYSEKHIDVDIKTAMRACIPYTDVPNDSAIVEFVNKCSNTLATVKYYIDNPDEIQKDLDMNMQDPNVKKLIHWIMNSYNRGILFSLMSANSINITTGDKRFDGAPMFTGKVFALTGHFRAGSHDDVEQILRSYGGSISKSIGPDVSCLITGGTLEDINTTMIRKARNQNIQVYGEDEFFSAYGILDDIADIGV